MASAETEKRLVKLQFHYLKSTGYRETACHGVIGGVTPQKKIWMAFFAERGPIPRVVEFEIEAPEGEASVAFNEAAAKPSHVESRAGIVREVEFSAYLDLDTATRLQAWLGDRIAELDAKPEGKK
jgi:hypothetical protein